MGKQDVTLKNGSSCYPGLIYISGVMPETSYQLAIALPGQLKVQPA